MKMRLAERRRVKALIVGSIGVGKTPLLHTLDPVRYSDAWAKVMRPPTSGGDVEVGSAS